MNTYGEAPLTAAAVDNLYQWGANFVRVPISSDLFLAASHQTSCSSTYDPNYISNLENEVKMIESFGMLALVDFHSVNPNCYSNPVGTSSPAGGVSYPLPDIASAQMLFADLANDFPSTSNPLVAYELYNEPHVCVDTSGTEPAGTLEASGSTTCDNGWTDQFSLDNNAWLNGGTVGPTGQSYQGAGMAQLYNDIRRQPSLPPNLIFVDSNYYASLPATFAAAPSSWTNVVYVMHYYACGDNGYGPSAATLCNSPTPEVPATIECDLINDLAQWTTAGGQPCPSGNPTTTGSPWPAPTVFDEWNWDEDQGAGYYYDTNGDSASECAELYPTLGASSGCTKINVEGKGDYVNNVIAYLQTRGVGWSLFDYANQVPSTGTGSTCPVPPNAWQIVCSANQLPWTPTVDDLPGVNAMEGQTLTFKTPSTGQ